MNRTRVLTLPVLALLLVGLLAGCKGSTAALSQSGASNGAGGAVATTAGGTAATTAAAGCASAGTKSFAKTKFLLHAGLATGAFHRYIYKPLKGQQFSSGAEHRVSAFVKAGAAALFVVHELKLAKEDAAASPQLCKLTAPLDNASTEFTTLASKLKGGTATSSDLTNADTQVSSLTSQSASSGATINDVTPPANLNTNDGP